MCQKRCAIALIIGWFVGAMLLLSCAGMVSEMAPDNEAQINSYTEQIEPRITWEMAMNNIELAKGKVVKWDGRLVRIWENKIQVFGRGQEEMVNNFIVELDHPLPKEQGIGDMRPTVSTGKTVWVVGRVIDKQIYVTRNGINMTLPVLKGYMISRDNDRDFKHPVWIATQ